MQTSFAKYRYLLPMLILFLLNTTAYTQEEYHNYDPGKDVLAPAPTAASLGKYGDIPVSLYTGKADIQVPIHTLGNKKIKVPITLSYNPSGIKVEQQASRVGLGWDLNAGGVITRTVKGLPDDTDISACADIYTNQGGTDLYQNAGYLYSLTEREALMNTHFEDPDLGRIALGYLDTEPDIFYFNFGGYSGKFIFDRQGVPRIISSSDLKIQYSIAPTSQGGGYFPNFPYSDHPQEFPDWNYFYRLSHFSTHGGIDEFVITTPDGNRYIFNERELMMSKAESESYDNFTCGSSGIPNFGHDWQSPYTRGYVSAWYLSKIESFDQKEEITFNYANGVLWNATIGEEKLVPNSSSPKQPTISYSKIFTKRLTGIETSRQKVEFLADHERQDVHTPHYGSLVGTFEKPMAITAIHIKDKNNQLVKGYDLSYNYFTASDQPCSSANPFHQASFKRLKLNSIKQISAANVVPPYVFEYNNNALPSRYSREQDFWGYFNDNGASSPFPKVYVYPDDRDHTVHSGVYSLFPRVQYQGTQFILQGADRYANPSANQAGVLKKITYPTGGSSRFEYETHTFLLEGQTQNGGGLRIFKTIDDDGRGSIGERTKTYRYNRHGTTTTSGRIMSMPQFANFRYITNITNSNWSTSIRYALSTEGIESTYGSFVGYENVIIDHDGDGYEEMTYALPVYYGITSDECNGSLCLYETPKSSLFLENKIDNRPFPQNPEYDWRRGQILEERKYKEDNTLLEKSEYEYELADHAKVQGMKVRMQFHYTIPMAGQIWINGIMAHYYHLTGWSRLKRKETLSYREDGSSSTHRKELGYGNQHHMPISSLLNGKYMTREKFPLDYNANNGFAKTLADLHRIDQPIETVQSILDQYGNEKVIGAELVTFKDYGNDVFMPFEQMALEIASPVTNFNPSSFNSSGNLVKDTRYTTTGSISAYDDRANFTEYQKQGGITSSIIWGYDKELPVASVANAKAEDVIINNFEYDNSWNNRLISSSTPHTGTKVGTASTSLNGWVTYKEITPSEQHRPYRLSAWTKGSGVGQLRILAYYNGTVIGQVSKSHILNNDWHLHKIEIDPDAVRSSAGLAESATLQLRARIDKPSGTVLLIDDIRFAPTTAILQTVVYDTENYQVTGMADGNNLFNFYEYDDLGRLQYSYDQDRNLLQSHRYNYKPTLGIENYVRTRNYKAPSLNASNWANIPLNQKEETYQYYDGIGRPIQTVQTKGSPNMKDIVSFRVYGKNGTEGRKYLPYTVNSSAGSFRYNPLFELAAFYQNTPNVANTTKPFAQQMFEQSPLRRLREKGNQGEDWQISTGNTSKYRYGHLEGGYVFDFNQVGAFGYAGSYSDYTVLHTTDAEGKVTMEFKDGIGRKILSRNKIGNEYADTYTLYDDMGMVTMVAPPNAVKNLLDCNANNGTAPPFMVDMGNCNWDADLVYLYQYDERGRLIAKKIPGADWIYYVYDNIDRVILVQNGNDRLDNKWQFTKYTSFGRTAMTGLVTLALSRSTAQAVADNLYSNPNNLNYEEPASGNHGYTNRTYPLTQLEPHTVNYYNNYDFDQNGTADYTFQTHTEFSGNTPFYRLNGQKTGSKVRILGTNEWLYKVDFYDDRGRRIQSKAQHHLSGYNLANTQYNFSGNIVKTRLEHRVFGKNDIVIRQRFDYDHSGRTLNAYFRIDNTAEIRLSNQQYSELGKLIEKNLHSTNFNNSSTHYLQSIDYAYNIRGWLETINEMGATFENEGPILSLKTNEKNAKAQTGEYNLDLFSMRLNYNTGNQALNADARHDGNISNVIWKVQGEDRKAYGYQYDDLGRITNAQYNRIASSASGWGYFDQDRYGVSNISYDLNGNIQSLMRNGMTGNQNNNPIFGVIDNLSYTYDGDQLTTVSDASNSTYGFTNGTNQSVEYTYDKNGNITLDKNKNVSTEYNHLNLPTKATFSNSRKIEWVYDATGVKLKKIVSDKFGVAKTTDYISGHEYYEGDLTAIYHEEGRITPIEDEGGVINSKSSTDYNYEYSIKDHLGNSRVMFSDLDKNGQVNSSEILQIEAFYPFGLSHEGTQTPQIGLENPYQFNGMEDVSAHGLNLKDYGARQYDAAIARWTSIDPLAEDYSSWSPYNYVLNNPIYFTDPTGMNPRGFDDSDVYDHDISEHLVYIEVQTPDGAITTVKVTVKFKFDGKSGTWQFDSAEESGNGYADLENGGTQVTVKVSSQDESEIHHGSQSFNLKISITVKPDDVTYSKGNSNSSGESSSSKWSFEGGLEKVFGKGGVKGSKESASSNNSDESESEKSTRTDTKVWRYPITVKCNSVCENGTVNLYTSSDAKSSVTESGYTITTNINGIERPLIGRGHPNGALLREIRKGAENYYNSTLTPKYNHNPIGSVKMR